MQASSTLMSLGKVDSKLEIYPLKIQAKKR